jgi:acyl-CoA reductase-like NAD-dependent aldehyde dehydrogenase
MADALLAGIMWITEYHRIDPTPPCGGFGMSRYCHENRHEAVRMFTQVKSVWVGLEQQPLDWYSSESLRRLN